MTWSPWSYDPPPAEPEDSDFVPPAPFGGRHPRISVKRCVALFTKPGTKPWERGPVCFHCNGLSEEHRR